MTERVRTVVQAAMGSWPTTLRFCVIVIVVVAAIALIPIWPVQDLAPHLFMD